MALRNHSATACLDIIEHGPLIDDQHGDQLARFPYSTRRQSSPPGYRAWSLSAQRRQFDLYLPWGSSSDTTWTKHT